MDDDDQPQKNDDRPKNIRPLGEAFAYVGLSQNLKDLKDNKL